MKRIWIGATAFAVVLALLVTSTVIALESTEEEPEPKDTEVMNEQNMNDLFESILEGDEMEAGEEGSGDVLRFAPLVKRANQWFMADFITGHSEWDRLPTVKTIFTAESAGKWMYEALPRINETGEALIVDEDGDGQAEMVLWKHVEEAGVPADELELDRIEEAKDIDLSGSVVKGRISWVLLYIDRNDDANPELVTLNYTRKVIMDTDDDGRPEGYMSFRWMGICADWNSDGVWDVQGFRTGYALVIDLNSDRAPEIKLHRSAAYMRFSRPGSPTWNRIEAHASKGKVLDLDSDSVLELLERSSVRAIWINRDGDRWPEDLRYSRNEHLARDMNSDGNPEVRERTSMNVDLIDRNDDMNPELVRIEYVKTSYLDRDSDGRMDQVRLLKKLFLWIDRNSDGIPERVVRSSFEEMRAPSANDEVEPRFERKREYGPEDKDTEGPGTGNGEVPEDRPYERERDGPGSEDGPGEGRDPKEPSMDDTGRIDRRKI
ncbi:MAG: hypothetical protein ACMUHB_02115 [Thermoplasmatota archaeon]